MRTPRRAPRRQRDARRRRRRRSAAPICISDGLLATRRTPGTAFPSRSANASRERERERDAEQRRRPARSPSDSAKISRATKPLDEAERLQRRVLGVALARGHRHRVGHHRHDDDDHDERHRLDRDQDRLGHRDEAELERLLGLGQRLGERIPERRVDRLRDLRRLRRDRAISTTKTPTWSRAAREALLDRSRSGSPSGRRTVDVVGLGVGAVVDAAQRERPGARDRSCRAAGSCRRPSSRTGRRACARRSRPCGRAGTPCARRRRARNSGYMSR